MGFVLDFWKIAMRPGKPLMFGRLGDVPVLGLPGNPVSALVTALLFMVPMLRGLSGLPTDIPMVTARLGSPLPANGEREAYLRGSVDFREDGSMVATPFDQQDSSVLSGIAMADALIVRPANCVAADSGDPVSIMPLNSIA
jgi:molybdopterin molybdotransferase